MRSEREWTQAELSSRSGVPQTTISGWERGAIVYPSLKHLDNIAKAFSIKICNIPLESQNSKCKIHNNEQEKMSILID